MKIPINLASQPFRRDRAMLAASIAVSLLLAGTLAGLISLVLSDRAELGDIRANVDRLHRNISRSTTDQARLDGVLRRPENAQVLDESVFLNELLYRKGISWTQIFADLEKVLPYNVRLMTIRPYVNNENRVTLDMTVGAEMQPAVIDFLKALESSPLFRQAYVPSCLAPSQSDPLYRCRVTVNYAQKL